VLTTPRLILRQWRPADRAPFAALNGDPQVMQFMRNKLDRTASDALADRIEAHIAAHGFGLWAVEVPQVAPFIGFVGFAAPSFRAHFTPCMEIGWRLARAHWGFGYATEAASAAMAHGFQSLGLPEIVSFTFAGNARSRAVMERLGMTHDPRDDFDHPMMAENHPRRPQVLYRKQGLLF
jgi:ribosomal-protein-alanine N-acetyltransferase